MQPNLTWPTHPTKNKAKPPQHQPNLFHEMPSGAPCPTWCTQVNQLSQYDSAPQDKIPANWKNILKPKGKETLQNQFSIGKVKPEINTSPMTNIWYYAHTQKQTSLFPFKSQEKKNTKNCSEGFLERIGMTASYYIATSPAIKQETVVK